MLSFLSNSVVASSILLGIVSAVADQAIARDIATVKPTLANSTQAITQQVQASRPEVHATSVYSQQQFVEQLGLIYPRYSQRASDLQIIPSLTANQNLNYLFTLSSSSPISETVTQQPDQAKDSPPNKSQYSLFKPTPRNLLRDFSTDRPNLATSPLTVDAGIFQIETDIVNYTRKGSDEEGNTNEKFLFASNTFRVGLTNNVEFRLLFQPYNLVRTRFRDTGKVQEDAGIDTLQTGLKINLYGNDTYTKPGAVAFGLLPFLNIPTARNGVSTDSVEGGLAFLSTFKLSDTLDLEVQLEADILKNGSGTGYHAESFNVVSLDYQITPSLGTFFEISSRFNNESRFGAIATFDTGLLINLGNDLQLDVGVFVGLTRATDDINPFLGISKRF